MRNSPTYTRWTGRSSSPASAAPIMKSPAGIRASVGDTASVKPVSILFLPGECLLERRRIVAADHVVANNRHRNRTKAAREERNVGAIVLVHVHHGKHRPGA